MHFMCDTQSVVESPNRQIDSSMLINRNFLFNKKKDMKE